MCPITNALHHPVRINMKNGVRTARLMHSDAMLLCFDRGNLDQAREQLLNRTGVYFLQNERKIYVGMSDTLFQRLSNHMSDQYRAYWERTWVFLSNDNMLTGDEARELERRFAMQIRENGRFELATLRVSTPNLHADYRLSADAFFHDFCLLLEMLYSDILLPAAPPEPDVPADPPTPPTVAEYSLGANPDVTYRTLKAFSLFGAPMQECEVWRTMLIALAEELIRRGHDLSALSPAKISHERYPGKSCHQLSNGLYLYTHLSAQNVCVNCRSILRTFGYSADEVRIRM